MKKVMLLIVLMLLVVPATGKAKNQDKGYFTVGSNKDYTVFETGGTRGDKLFGFGVSLYDGADDTLQIGDKRNKDAFACKFGFEVAKNSNLYLNGILGLSRTEKCIWGYDLLYDKGCPLNDGHCYQAYKKIDKGYGVLCGVGVSCFIPNLPIVVSADYDNVRKFTGSAGLVWKF